MNDAPKAKNDDSAAAIKCYIMPADLQNKETRLNREGKDGMGKDIIINGLRVTKTMKDKQETKRDLQSRHPNLQFQQAVVTSLCTRVAHVLKIYAFIGNVER